MLKKKIIEKKGNNFIGGLLIVFAGIGIGTILLTYQDFNSSKHIDTSQMIDIEVKESSLIIQEMNEEEKRFQEQLLAQIGKTNGENSISVNNHLKTTLSFDTLGEVTILEEYVDETISIYLCDIYISNKGHQYIKVVIDENNILSMVVVNENGQEIDEDINLPLTMSEQIVQTINSLYNIRKG